MDHDDEQCDPVPGPGFQLWEQEVAPGILVFFNNRGWLWQTWRRLLHRTADSTAESHLDGRYIAVAELLAHLQEVVAYSPDAAWELPGTSRRPWRLNVRRGTVPRRFETTHAANNDGAWPR